MFIKAKAIDVSMFDKGGAVLIGFEGADKSRIEVAMPIDDFAIARSGFLRFLRSPGAGSCRVQGDCTRSHTPMQKPSSLAPILSPVVTAVRLKSEQIQLVHA
jgi:hypothetical protein